MAEVLEYALSFCLGDRNLVVVHAFTIYTPQKSEDEPLSTVRYLQAGTFSLGALCTRILFRALKLECSRCNRSALLLELP